MAKKKPIRRRGRSSSWSEEYGKGMKKAIQQLQADHAQISGRGAVKDKNGKRRYTGGSM